MSSAAVVIGTLRVKLTFNKGQETVAELKISLDFEENSGIIFLVPQ